MTHTSLQVVEYVEIDIDYCSLTHGTAPCTATGSGDARCYNSLASCQDRVNFTNAPVTLRFSTDSGFNPKEIVALPLLENIQYNAGRISLGEDLGQRSSITFTFSETRHPDTGDGFDKYRSGRTVDPYTQGSFWGKFRARQAFLKGRPIRLIRGFVGQALADMETRSYVIESFNGPTLDGRYTIVAKDILKLLDGDRAKAPALSGGFLASSITSSDVQLSLSPTGAGDLYYPAEGKVAIGGKETVSFLRDVTAGNDANCKLLLHFGGSDASTTFTDSSSSARTGTAVGNAQIDTAKAKFGTGSGLFDGTGDYVTFPDSADWTFAGDFTIECFVWFNSLAATDALWSHSTDANNQYRLYSTTAGALTFEVKSASVNIVSMASATGVAVTGEWMHIAVVRSGNNWNIYKNGVSVASTTDADAIPNFTSTFRIGADGAATNIHNGWIDAFRVSSVARWTTTFTPPICAYQTTADIMVMTARGLNGSTAVAHESQLRVQLCLSYTGEDPADIIRDLMVTYGGVDTAYINLTEWQEETAAYNRQIYTTIIAEPVPVRTLISELVQQAGLAIWWDDVNVEVRLQVLRQITTGVTYDFMNYLEDTLRIEEQPDKRISRIWTYFAQRNPLEPQNDPSNYQSCEITVNTDTEQDDGVAAIKVVYSRWIPYGGRSVATRHNNIQLGRYSTPPRKFAFDLLRSEVEGIELGAGYQLGPPNNSRYWPLQDFDGTGLTIPFQVTRDAISTAHHRIEGEELNFISLDSDDLANRVISIDANGTSINLKTIHDAIYPVAVIGDEVTFRVLSGVLINGSTASLPAIDTGVWPSVARTGNRTNGSAILTGLSSTTDFTAGMGVEGTGIPAGSKILTVDSATQITLDHNATSGAGTATSLTIWTVILNLEISGRVQGKGGDGGDGYRGSTNTAAQNGEDGGTALYVQSAINVTINTTGKLYGGGGGGGGCETRHYTNHFGGGGGGGAGSNIGNGARGYGSSTDGGDGTLDDFGVGGQSWTTDAWIGSPFLTGYTGGDGGALGSAGNDGETNSGVFGSGGNGGAAGRAIDGVSKVVLVNNGAILGTQVN